MCECYDNVPDFYDASIVKARKPHRCCECLREIELGERYERASGKWDGDFETFATCGTCLDLIGTLGIKCRLHACLHEELAEGNYEPLTARGWLSLREENRQAIIEKRKVMT